MLTFWQTQTLSVMVSYSFLFSKNKLTPVDDNDGYVVYPDVDGDEDVVYAYHAINDK